LDRAGDIAPPRWLRQFTSDELLAQTRAEWQPWFRLLRVVSSQPGWSDACLALGRELHAITGAERITLWSETPWTDTFAWALAGAPVSIPRIPEQVGQVVVADGCICVRLSMSPKLWLVLNRANLDLIKAVSVLGEELGQALGAAKLRAELRNGDHLGSARSAKPGGGLAGLLKQLRSGH